MRRTTLHILLAGLLVVAAHAVAQRAVADGERLVFTGVTIIDPAGGAARSGWTIACEGAVLSEVVEDDRFVAREGDRVRPFPGRFVVPGLCDDSMRSADPADLVLAVTSGVTTVRLATNEAALASVRARIEAGEFAGPTVLPTPAPVEPHDERGLHAHLKSLVDGGATPLDALASVTTAFEDGRFGRIEPGAPADLLLCRADPRKSIDALQELDAIVRGGALYLRGWIAATRDRIPRARAAAGKSLPSSENDAGRSVGVFIGRFDGVPFARAAAWLDDAGDSATITVRQRLDEPYFATLRTRATSDATGIRGADVAYASRSQRFEAHLDRTGSRFEVTIAVDDDPTTTRAVTRPSGETIIIDECSLFLAHRAALLALDRGATLSINGQELVFGEGPISLASAVAVLERIDVPAEISAVPGIRHAYRLRSEAADGLVGLDAHGHPVVWRLRTEDGTIWWEREENEQRLTENAAGAP